MANKKETETLEDFLNSAHGQLTITINGMVPNVKGTCNDPGAILAAFGCLKLIEGTSGCDFKELVNMMCELNDVMKYTIVNRKNM